MSDNQEPESSQQALFGGKILDPIPAAMAKKRPV